MILWMVRQRVQKKKLNLEQNQGQLNMDHFLGATLDLIGQYKIDNKISGNNSLTIALLSSDKI